MEYTFKVWIDGNYYHDDEEYEVEIELTDVEHETLKKIVKEYDGDFSRGLMPILKNSDDNLFQLFYDEIFPNVFFTLFQRDPCFEPNPGDEGKIWNISDVDYLMETYGDGYCDSIGINVPPVSERNVPPSAERNVPLVSD